jgi:hypothetical protein
MMEASLNSHAEYVKIRCPALSFAVVGFTSKMWDFVKTLPDPARKRAEEFLNSAGNFGWQETKHFRKEIPNGRVIECTNVYKNCYRIRITVEGSLFMEEFLEAPGVGSLKSESNRPDGKWVLTLREFKKP